MSKARGANKPTAEEIGAREIRARRKFKAVARIVMANLFWLGDVDDMLGSNVRLNIQKLTRKKTKKSTLTTQDKILLTKPIEERTEEEKRLIDRAIGGLKCFRRYPAEVKTQLAAVTYFVYIGPGRVIVRQDHAPSALYFLLSGEAAVTVKEYDKLFNEWVETDHGIIGPGTMFGEVALLHGISRTATLTTTQPCELLRLRKEDFDIVLKETVWKAWEQSQKIMNRFSYFKNWDDVTKRECSIISRTKAYVPDEVIFGDDCGLPNYTYLITKGTVYIVEQVMMHVIDAKGIKKYKLVNPDEKVEDIFGTNEEDAEDLIKKFLSEYDKKKNPKSKSSLLLERSVSTVRNKEYVRKMSLRKSATYSSTTGGGFTRKAKVETHFLKVCEMTAGAVFNIGENFFRRRVVAKSNVHCLLIPRYWLIKMNKDYIWSRVQQFLNKTIPNTEKIFRNFLEEQKFMRYRKSLVKDLLDAKNVANDNNIHNVPYSIRLKEGTSYNL